MARVYWSDFGPLALLAAPLVAVLVVGPYLPSTVVFGVLAVLAASLVQSAGVFTIARRANGESAPWGAAVRFGLRGLPRLIGWSIVCVGLAVPVIVLVLLPGFTTDSESLISVGTVVATALAMSVGGALYAALAGSVLVDGQGLTRARALLRGRWLATSLRMLISGLAFGAHSQLLEWLAATLAATIGPGLLAWAVFVVLMVPGLVFQVVVVVITYAELRGRADGTGTDGLAAGLVGLPSSARASALNGTSSGAPMGTVIIAGRRRRGFRWGAPVLVLAMLLGAGGPWWPGTGPSVAAVSPVVAVSPVPADLDGGAGGGSGGGSGGSGGGDDGGSPPDVSGSSKSDSDSGGGGGSGPPDVEPKGTPDSGAGGDKGGDSGQEPAPAASAPAESRNDSGTREGSAPDPVVAGPGPAESTQQGSASGSATASPGTGQATDQAGSTVAAPGPVKGAEQSSQVGVGPAPAPGTSPENSNVAATPRTTGTPEQPTSSAAAPPARVELPPGAVLAAPGSQPAPGTQRVTFDGQPVDMAPDMLEWQNYDSGTRDVWTASDRRMVVTGTCAEGTVDCTAHATDGSNQSFPFQRTTPDMSVRDAMNKLAGDRWAYYKANSGITATPTAAETEKIAADNAALEARNAQRAEVVSQALSIAPQLRALKIARTGAELLVPARPLFTRPPQPKNAVPAFGTRGESPSPATGTGPGRDLARSVGSTTSGETAAGPPANTIPGPPLGAPTDPKATDADTNTSPDTIGGPERPNLYQPDGTIQQWDPETKQYKTIVRPGDGAPPPTEGLPTPGSATPPNDPTSSGIPGPPPIGGREASDSAGSGESKKLLWTSWPNYPKVAKGGREYAQIGERLYTRHAVDRMQPSGFGAPAGASGPGRNISPTVVEDVIKNNAGTPEEGPDGEARLAHTAGNVKVITEDGIVVTVMRVR